MRGYFYPQIMTYAEKLRHPLWQKKRLEVLQRDNFTCALCGDTERELHVHHRSYKVNPWEVELSQLETLCCDCHSVTEFLKSKDILFPVHKAIKYSIKNSDILSVVFIVSREDLDVKRYSVFFFERNIETNSTEFLLNASPQYIRDICEVLNKLKPTTEDGK